MPIPTMRPYQADLLARVRARMSQGHKRVLVQAMVGAGKSVMIGEIVRSAVARQKRILLLVHRRRLIEQLSEELVSFDVPHGILMNGVRGCSSESVQIASKDTLISRTLHNQWIKPPPADLVIVDECHHLMSKFYLEIAKMYPDAYHLGFTATPAREDGRGLGDFYTSMECAISTQQLIEAGYIVPVKAYAPQQIGKGSSSGKRKLGGDPVSHWLRLGQDRPTLAFTATVKASRWLTVAFLMAGVVAEHLDAHMSDDERRAMLGRLARGETKIVSNCSVLTEGINVPNVSCVILLRMASSYTMYIQIVGRAMRASPGKDYAIILDHSDAVLHHGYPDQDVRWELNESERIEDRNKKDRKDGKIASPIACPACGMYYSGTITCPACGFLLPKKLQPPVLKHQILTEVQKDLSPEQLETIKERYWKSCLAMAAHKGGTCSMAQAMYRGRYKEFPSTKFRHAPTGSQWYMKVADLYPQFVDPKR